KLGPAKGRALVEQARTGQPASVANWPSDVGRAGDAVGFIELEGFSPQSAPGGAATRAAAPPLPFAPPSLPVGYKQRSSFRSWLIGFFLGMGTGAFLTLTLCFVLWILVLSDRVKNEGTSPENLAQVSARAPENEPPPIPKGDLEKGKALEIAADVGRPNPG